MTDDLHTLFRDEAARLPVGLPPSPAIIARARRRKVTSAVATGVLTVAAVGAGVVGLRLGLDGSPSTPVVDDPTTTATTEAATADPSSVSGAPATLPECFGSGLTLTFVDWSTNPAPTDVGAAERLVGRDLLDATVVEVSPERHDVAVHDEDRVLRAVVTVVRTGSEWNPTQVYQCTDDPIVLRP